MTTVEIVLGAILIAVSLFLIVVVLLQSSKSHGLSGTIAGGAETFFGKSKAQTLDKKLSVVTTVVAVVFVALVLCVYVMQDVDDVSGIHSDYVAPVTDTVTDGADSDTAAVTDADTSAATDADTAAATDADSAADTAATAAE